MSTCGDAERPKILVFATENNPLAARISLALVCVEFCVAALTRPGHPVREARKIPRHFAYHARFPFKSIIRAIDRWSPDLLVCTDDLAVRELQNLHKNTAASDDKAGRRISDLIELSLGPPTSFPAIRNKSDFLALAKLEGLRCPKTIVIPATGALKSSPGELTYPVVVKADHSSGGRCVRVVNSDADLRLAIWELQAPSTWRGRLFLDAMLGSEALSPLRLPLRRTISLQEYVVGHPGNRAVICWNGKVLAGISVEVVEVMHERGAASVIRLVNHPEMATVCERMVKRLNLSGFVGFDFMIDSANRAWLLEMNPRVTQTCHFSLADGTDLAATLYAQMTNQLPRPRPASINRDLIALFPNEIIRAPSSSYFLSCQHDVPWEEPELVRGVLNQIRRMQIRRQARRFAERHLPAVVSGLVRIGLLGARTASDSRPPFEVMAAPWEGITPPLQGRGKTRWSNG
jgi:glutathione synthase/RimK-type ligase-like ATP-grasp enzyme